MYNIFLCRDLKLGNVVLDRRSQEVTLTNFCLGKHLMRDDDLLKDQRGSPAYISPDVLSGKPYLGRDKRLKLCLLSTIRLNLFTHVHSKIMSNSGKQTMKKSYFLQSKN